MNVRLIAIAGPPSAGKTAVVKQIIRNLGASKVAYLKIDVVQAWEDEELAAEFGIPTKKVYSGDMCPDHMGIMVIRDALLWADSLDVAVVTKIDLVSQAEKEVFREGIRQVAPEIDIVETNAIQGTGMRYLMQVIERMMPAESEKDTLRGVPPLGVCTVCIGKKETGWQEHFGVIRPLAAPDNLYRGE